MTIPILYSDRDLAVCVKPRGVSSEQGGLPELLAAQLGDERVRCVHRLDVAVGGVMVYARSSRAAAGLSRQIADRTLQKEYLAVVPGRPETDEAVLRDLLFHDRTKNKSYVVRRMRAGVREAELSRFARSAAFGRRQIRQRVSGLPDRAVVAHARVPPSGGRAGAVLLRPAGARVSLGCIPIYDKGRFAMRYIEVIVNTPKEALDQRCEEMAAMGAGGFVIENEDDFRDFLDRNHMYWDYVDEELENRFAGVSRIKCYLTDDEDGLAVLRRIRDAYGTVETGFVEDSDWENNWREYYKPIEVGEKLVVVPAWEEAPEDGRVPLRLDPGLIFGTGSHATTRMCLAALERFSAPGVRVLDLGCGSGILGIGALVLGAKSCLGCDIDPKAPDVVMANAALNGIGADRLTACAGDVIADASLRRGFGTGYDLVLANIVSDVIIPLAPHVPGFLAPGGVFITSGIIEGRQDEVRAAIERAGLRVVDHHCEEEWHQFTAVLA